MFYLLLIKNIKQMKLIDFLASSQAMVLYDMEFISLLTFLTEKVLNDKTLKS